MVERPIRGATRFSVKDGRRWKTSFFTEVERIPLPLKRGRFLRSTSVMASDSYAMIWRLSDSVAELVYIFISGISGVSRAASGNLPESYRGDSVEARAVELSPVLTSATPAQLSGR
jgi:hypothetical protein